MELETLKKKLSSFKTPRGQLRNVSDDLLIEILKAWEQWSGPSSKFYTAIGSSYKQFAKLLGKAKKLKREGFAASDFEELFFEEFNLSEATTTPSCEIELTWEAGKVIRFGKVETLVEFLKKAA